MSILNNGTVMDAFDGKRLRVLDYARGDEDRAYTDEYLFAPAYSKTKRRLSHGLPIGQLPSSPLENDHCVVSNWSVRADTSFDAV